MSSLVDIQTNDLDLPVSYACDSLVRNNQVTPMYWDFYYDLARKETISAENAVALLEESLLRLLAGKYGLLNGSTCLNGPTEGLWLVQASSLPRDEPTDRYGKTVSAVLGCFIAKSLRNY
jgi:hypothetical protein